MQNGKYLTKASKTFQAGDNAWHGGLYDDARRHYAEAVKLYQADADFEGEAIVWQRLGELELSLDGFKPALEAFDKAAALVKDEPEAQNTYGQILIDAAKLYTVKNDLKKALSVLKQAEEVLSAIGSNIALGDAYDQKAYVYLMENKTLPAIEAYEKAVMCFKKERVGIKEASSLRALARLKMQEKSYDEAHDLLERCRDLYRENGDILGEASALSAIGTLRYIINDINNARKALMKSVFLYGRVSHHFAEAEALLYLARVETTPEKGDLERAKAHYKRSIELFSFLHNEEMKKAVLEEYESKF